MRGGVPIRIASLSLLLVSLAGCSVAGAGERENFVVVLADDIGVERIGAYVDRGLAKAVVEPVTPRIDALARDGLTFANAWAYPLCSSSRALLLTGRYGYRTGVRAIFHAEGKRVLGVDDPEAKILPQTLAARGYTSAAIGKWHLASGYRPDHPIRAGFGSFSGTLLNLSTRRGEDYGGRAGSLGWPKTTMPAPDRDDTGRCESANRPTATCRLYATRVTGDDAVRAVTTLPEPFFVYAAFQAPHRPFHSPPQSLYPELGTVSQDAPIPDQYRAMIATVDVELGRIRAALEARGIAGRTTVIFIADNGAPFLAAESEEEVGTGKGSLFEGGLRVPFLIASPRHIAPERRGDVVGSALVMLGDLYATLADLAGADAETAEDARSLLPCFADIGCHVHDTVYAERMDRRKLSPVLESDELRREHSEAIRDVAGYKLVRRNGADQALFRLPDERTNLLCRPLEAEELRAYETLARTLDTQPKQATLPEVAAPDGPVCPAVGTVDSFADGHARA